MTSRLTIAIDAMGGDNAPLVVLQGVKVAHVRFPDVRFLLFGDEARLTSMMAEEPELAGYCELRHAPDAVAADARPSQVVRSGRRSSMWLAAESVSAGEAAGVVSAGNTGALMAVSKFVLRTLNGIDRPAIAGLFPTERGESVMLDLGANVDCNANNLVEFAVMGEIFARVLLGLERPTVGLLNVGSEEIKGNDAVKSAAETLRSKHLPMSFHGFIEGTDIGAGTVDVIVTDGFTGNIALKSVEGTSKLYSRFLREAFNSSWISRLGYVMARPAIQKVRLRVDPRRYNGAMFLGLNGIAVKSHGGTDAIGFANAVGVAVNLAKERLNDRIKQSFEALHANTDPPQAAAG